MRALVTGAGGQLGQDLVCALGGSVPPGGTRRSLWEAGIAAPAGTRGVPGTRARSLDVVGADHATLDVADRAAVLAAVDALRPDVIFHVGAWTAVDACESDPDRAYAINAMGTRHVAEAARRHRAHLLYVSTDYVFDGTADCPYVEWDTPAPRSVYGASKLGGERECPPEATVVRTSWVCGAGGANMVKTALRLAADQDQGQSQGQGQGQGQDPLRFVDDQRGCPTFTADLAPALVTLGLDRRPGVYHVTNQGDTTWYGFVRAVLQAAGTDPARVQPIATAELDPPRPAPRPANSVLDNAALRLAGLPLLPDWHDGLERLIAVLGGAPTSGISAGAEE